MRAPGSGTAGRSARSGLVLLQSPAFRNAYIISHWGREEDLGVPYDSSISQVPGFGKEARTVAFKLLL